MFYYLLTLTQFYTLHLMHFKAEHWKKKMGEKKIQSLIQILESRSFFEIYICTGVFNLKGILRVLMCFVLGTITSIF